MRKRNMLHVRTYFDKTIHIQKIKDCISGKNEGEVIAVLKDLGYILGLDYIRQHSIGDRYVLDFAFVRYQIAIEVDGKDHRCKKQKLVDKERDNYLYENDWCVIRIPDDKFFGKDHYFYRNLLKEVIDERRRQWLDCKIGIKQNFID